MHRQSVILGLSLCLLSVLYAPSSAITIAENGQAVAVIVDAGVPCDARLAPKHVQQKHILPPGATLQQYLRQITGAELPIVATLDEAGGKPAIVLQLVDKTPGAADGPISEQAYRIKAEGDRLTLTAASSLAMHYAVYGLLEDHLGCRFYSFKRSGLNYTGKGYEIVPGKPTLELAGIDDFQQPSMANRGIIYWPGSYPWILQNRGIGVPGDHASGALAAGHTMYSLIPPKDQKRGKEVIKAPRSPAPLQRRPIQSPHLQLVQGRPPLLPRCPLRLRVLPAQRLRRRGARR